MAKAPGHRLGQIVGDVLEETIRPILQVFADHHELYLDLKGQRPARPGKKVTWVDDLGNAHDLDFVLERGGDNYTIGLPAAFIESAWRRYTKHSRAKAGEIQQALLPLLAKYSQLKPFAGAVVAGDWTDGALTQMTSSGFCILHIPTKVMVAAFGAFDIDITADEGTADAYLQKQVDTFELMGTQGRARIAKHLREAMPDEFKTFTDALQIVVLRRVVEVYVLPLYGESYGFDSVQGAMQMLADYRTDGSGTFVKFEIVLKYSNGDEIRASFRDASDALAFLETFT